MNKKYDLAVAYRIYPKVSKIPPIYQDDKLKLSELCLKSFKIALGNLRVKLFVILDNCPEEYDDLFKKYFDESDLELIKLNGIGNAGTFIIQTEILLEQDYSETIYFAEDDYLYLPNEFHRLLEFLKNQEKVDFVTPYDHPDYYHLDLHKYKKQKINYSGKEWKKISTTTMTFLTTKATFKETLDIFKTYAKNNYDTSIWLVLTKLRIYNPFLLIKYSLYNDKMLFRIYAKAWFFGFSNIIFGKKYHLWCPEPGLATHMDSEHMAPEIEWNDLMMKLNKN